MSGFPFSRYHCTSVHFHPRQPMTHPSHWWELLSHKCEHLGAEVQGKELETTRFKFQP